MRKYNTKDVLEDAISKCAKDIAWCIDVIPAWQDKLKDNQERLTEYLKSKVDLLSHLNMIQPVDCHFSWDETSITNCDACYEKFGPGDLVIKTTKRMIGGQIITGGPFYCCNECALAPGEVVGIWGIFKYEDEELPK
jgi:hypothetical protein